MSTETPTIESNTAPVADASVPLSAAPVADAIVSAPEPAADPISETAIAVSVPESSEVSATAVAVAVPEGVAVPKTLAPELLKVIETIVEDIKKDSSKTFSAPELLRYIPRLAACVQSLKDLNGPQKSELVILAGHELINRLLPENDRAVAHNLVDAVFPSAIVGVVDVAKGRVSFGQAAQAAAIAAAPAVLQVCQRDCLPLCLAWIQRK